MTPTELRLHMNELYGPQPWPKVHHVDAETYGNVCQEVFDYLIHKHAYNLEAGMGYHLDISVGFNGGLMYRNVELVIHGHQIEPRTAAGSLD
jgi:hypothetical protein